MTNERARARKKNERTNFLVRPEMVAARWSCEAPNQTFGSEPRNVGSSGALKEAGARGGAPDQTFGPEKQEFRTKLLVRKLMVQGEEPDQTFGPVKLGGPNQRFGSVGVKLRWSGGVRPNQRFGSEVGH